MTDEHIPDRFDIALKRWTTEGKLVDDAWEVVQDLDLDPAFAEAVEDACRKGDVKSMSESLTDLVGAMGEAKGKPVTDLLRAMEEIKRRLVTDW